MPQWLFSRSQSPVRPSGVALHLPWRCDGSLKPRNVLFPRAGSCCGCRLDRPVAVVGKQERQHPDLQVLCCLSTEAIRALFVYFAVANWIIVSVNTTWLAPEMGSSVCPDSVPFPASRKQWMLLESFGNDLN